MCQGHWAKSQTWVQDAAGASPQSGWKTLCYRSRTNKRLGTMKRDEERDGDEEGCG